MTDRLLPSDAAFLSAEDSGAPMQVGGVMIVRPAGEFDFGRVIDAVTERLVELPRFRQIVRRVPANLARPVWVDDADFDVNYHVRRASLPGPGDERRLAELVGRLLSRPLDRTRPLWELYIVEGLRGGLIALVNKTHEALSGGVGPADVAAALLDDADATDREPGRRSVRRRRDVPWIPAPEPSAADLIVGAVGELLSAPGSAFDAARDAAGLWRADIRQSAMGALDFGRGVLDVALRAAQFPQRSLLHTAVPGPRLFAMTDIDLDALKAIRRRHGVSINDAILTVLTGALRSWLISHGDPASTSTRLVALAPLSVRADDADADGDAASVSSFLISLPIAEPNPVVRLHQVAFHTRSHGGFSRRIGARSLLSLGRFAPGALHLMGARLGSQLSRRSYDVLITNVPGPQHPLSAAGDEVIAMYPAVPLAKGHAVAVGCTSYRGRVHFGLTADRAAMSDVQDFARLIDESVAELVRAAPSEQSRDEEAVTGGRARPTGRQRAPRRAAAGQRSSEADGTGHA